MGWMDSDYASDPDTWKSVMGYMLSLNNAPISVLEGQGTGLRHAELCGGRVRDSINGGTGGRVPLSHALRIWLQAAGTNGCLGGKHCLHLNRQQSRQLQLHWLHRHASILCAGPCAGWGDGARPVCGDQQRRGCAHREPSWTCVVAPPSFLGGDSA
eukprot:2255876-Rhodomonas_salina.1